MFTLYLVIDATSRMEWVLVPARGDLIISRVHTNYPSLLRGPHAHQAQSRQG